MILLAGLLLGCLAGIVAARLRRLRWSPPQVRLAWLAILAFLPQLAVFYLSPLRTKVPPAWAAAGLVLSQALLLAFCWFNRKQPGFWLVAFGLGLNLLVIVCNGGFMPISPQTAGRLVSAGVLEAIPLGSRFGYGKDILLLPGETRLPFLSDRLLLPEWSPYQVAFSLGDVIIAIGAFVLMVIGNPYSKPKEDAAC